MSDFRVYLGGKIYYPDPYFARWRQEVASRLYSHGVRALDPILAKERVEGSSSKGSFSDAAFTLRDYHMLTSCNLMIANLKLVGDNGLCPQPIIGTYFEMAWAWDKKTPILAIVDEDSRFLREHQFLATAVTEWFTDHSAAAKHIVEYWKWTTK